MSAGIPFEPRGIKNPREIEEAFKIFSQAATKYHPQSMECVMAVNYVSCLAWVLCMPKYMESNQAIIDEFRRVLGSHEKTLEQVLAENEIGLRRRG